jgi:hypothetical protein
MQNHASTFMINFITKKILFEHLGLSPLEIIIARTMENQVTLGERYMLHIESKELYVLFH